MDKDTEIIMKKLIDGGYKAHYVGGCVRDIQLGIWPNDFDIVTDATPKKIIKLFNLNSVKPVISTTNFLVTMVDGIEIATYRSEEYHGHNGKPEVQRAITLEDDLSRRDLTINAMAMDINGHLIDPFDGLDDLHNKIIKFVGSPEKRIFDDPCRIIRAIRFHTLLGEDSTIEEETRSAMKKYSSLVLKHVPVERIKLELLKSLNYEKPSIFFRTLEEFGLLKMILPSLHNCIGVWGGKYHNEDIFTHSLLCGDFIPKSLPFLRLVGYLHDIGKPDAFNGENFRDHAKIGEALAHSDLFRLRFSTKSIRFVTSLIRNHMRFVSGMKKSSLRKLNAELKEEEVLWKDLVLLKIADRNANLAKPNFTRKDIQKLVMLFYKSLKEDNIFRLKDLVVDGNDLMVYLGYKQGKELGLAMSFLFKRVLEKPELNTNKFVLMDQIASMKNTYDKHEEELKQQEGDK